MDKFSHLLVSNPVNQNLTQIKVGDKHFEVVFIFFIPLFILFISIFIMYVDLCFYFVFICRNLIIFTKWVNFSLKN